MAGPMVRLIRRGTLDNRRVVAAITAAFEKRANHDVPRHLKNRRRTGMLFSTHWQRNAVGT
jgi:hypothetical protein